MKSANSGRIVRKRFEKGYMEVEGFEYNRGLRYISMNREYTSELEELEYMLPKRRKKQGVTPGMTGANIRAQEDDPEAQWRFPKKEEMLTELEKRKIRARVAEIGVRVLFENFTYRWGGDTYKQSSGGPIGCRVTMAVSRLVMQDWAENYREVLDRSGVDIAMLTGYVDDNRQLTRILRMGMSYNVEQKMFTFLEAGE